MNYRKKKALFLDRDGVINVDHGHVYRIEDFKFIDGIFELCQIAQQKNYIIVVITNQAGIGKGFYTEQDFHILDDWMICHFSHHGINIAKTYYCPHKSEENCNCRKPNPGMILDAINEFSIDPEKSVLIGDKKSDIVAANRANVFYTYLFNESDHKHSIKYLKCLE